MIPEAAVGAIIAAFIAALISLLGLIISKEQKTSEFRQAWIGELRNELVSYATRINAILDASGVEYKDYDSQVNALSPHYIALNQASFSISLRLNRDEDLSKEVLRCIKEFHGLASKEDKLNSDNLRPLEKKFISASQELLKYEWKRVKNGEATFRIAKIIALLVAAMAIVVLPIAALRLSSTTNLSGENINEVTPPGLTTERAAQMEKQSHRPPSAASAASIGRK